MRRTFNHRYYFQICIAATLIAVPLFAYANIEAGALAVAQPAYLSPSPLEPETSKISCSDQHWPNFSAECVRGGEPIGLRQIALVTGDAPLSSLPRVIDAPATRQHVITTDAQPHIKRSHPQRTYARVTYRREARRDNPLPMPTAMSELGSPDGW